MPMSDRLTSMLRGMTRLAICVVLAGCASSNPLVPSLKPEPCAADRPTINAVLVDGYFVISKDDMGQLTGYMAALEAGCVAPKQVDHGVTKTTQ